MQQDAMQTKEKIISLLRMNGPSLPVHIAKGTGLSILFASAFLSELFYEKKIGISNLKVGNSPLYFIPGQELQLERFAENNLKNKEKEAFLLLKNEKFLKDSEQQPAIRVALREIRDFAIPLKKEEEIYWRYFTVSEQEFNKKEIPKEKIIVEEIQKSAEQAEESEEEEEQENSKEELNIFDKEDTQKKEKRKITKKRKSQKQDENFFNKVKEFLSGKKIEIIDIQNFNKNDLVLKIKENKEEKLLIAYNKKKITNADLIKAYKKSAESDLPYIILSLGEPARNIKELVSAIKNLSKIDKIE